MKIRHLAYFVFSTALLSSCTIATENKYAFITGDWHLEGTDMYESWWLDEEGELVGLSTYNNGDLADTIEQLQIIRTDEGAMLESLVKGENGGMPVSFGLKSHDENTLVFENPIHDFPQVIKYHKVSEARIEVEISGEDYEGEKVIQFTYLPVITNGHKKRE